MAKILKMELGRTNNGLSAWTDSGDHILYTKSGITRVSNASGFEPSIFVNGVVSGLEVTPDTTNNKVAISAGTANIAGALATITADTATIVRGAGANAYKWNSITLTSGAAFAVVQGIADTTYTAARGVSGGPPVIPTGSVLLADTLTTTTAAGLLAAGEIYSVPNTNREEAFYPGYTLDYVTGGLRFDQALALIHSGSVTKKVFLNTKSPTLSQITYTKDVVVPKNAYSGSSSEYYGGALNSVSISINTGSMTVALRQGIRDSIIGAHGDIRHFELFPDDSDLNQSYRFMGTVGVVESFPAGGQSEAAVTVVSETEAVRNLA